MTSSISAELTDVPDPTPRWLLEGASVLGLAWGLSRGLGVRMPGIDLLGVAVALIGAQFGLWAGALGGVAAGTLVLAERHASVGAWFAMTGDRSPVYAASSVLIVGALAGMIGEGHQRRQARGNEALDATLGRLARVQHRIDTLLEAKETLERRFVRQVQPLASLYRAIQGVDVAPAACPDEALRLAARYCEAGALAYYERDDEGLRLARALGDHAERAEAVGPGDHLLALVLGTGKPIAARTRAEYAELSVLMAAPVPGPHGTVRGVLAVEELPFARLNPASARMVELLAEWLGMALEAPWPRARGPLPAEAFQLELAREWQLAERFKLPLAVLGIRREGVAGDAGWWEAVEALAATPGARVGVEPDGVSGWVLLPATWPEAAGAIAERLAEALGARVSAGSHGEATPSADLLLRSLAPLDGSRERAHDAW